MLRDDLYYIRSHEDLGNGSHRFLVELDVDHPIFKGHFDGQPVLPGVCMMQMSREMAQYINDQAYFLKEGKQAKFLRLIDPRADKEILLELKVEEEEGGVRLQSSLLSKDKETRFFSLKGSLAFFS